MARLNTRIQGLAISTILLAVVLLAAIAVTIAMSSRSGQSNSTDQQNHLMATSLINQAQNLVQGMQNLAGTGIDINTITLDADPTHGLYNPALGGTPQQIPPPNAQYGGAASWHPWSLRNNIALMNIGTTAPEIMVMLTDITYPVCVEINKILGIAEIAPGTVPYLTTPAATQSNLYDMSYALDLAADAATQNLYQGCLTSSDQNLNFYFSVAEVH